MSKWWVGRNPDKTKKERKREEAEVTHECSICLDERIEQTREAANKAAVGSNEKYELTIKLCRLCLAQMREQYYKKSRKSRFFKTLFGVPSYPDERNYRLNRRFYLTQIMTWRTLYANRQRLDRMYEEMYNGSFTQSVPESGTISSDR